MRCRYKQWDMTTFGPVLVVCLSYIGLICLKLDLTWSYIGLILDVYKSYIGLERYWALVEVRIYI